MAATQCVRTALREADVIKLALPEKLHQVAHRILDGYLRINAGRHEHVDLLGAAERRNRLVDAVAEVIRPSYNGQSEFVGQDVLRKARALPAYLPESYRPSLSI